jgi:hypothetical protein
MGLRCTIKGQIHALLARLSGEHSDAAPEPEARTDYARPGKANPSAKVVMARLKRPGAADAGDES